MPNDLIEQSNNSQAKTGRIYRENQIYIDPSSPDNRFGIDRGWKEQSRRHDKDRYEEA
jgi:hypothetical protein